MDKELYNIFKDLSNTKTIMFEMIKESYYSNQNIQDEDIEHYLDSLLSCINSQESIEFYNMLCEKLLDKNSKNYYTRSLKNFL